MSVVTETESLVKPIRQRDQKSLIRFRSFFALDVIRIVEVSRGIAREAARIRADTALGLADSLIAATALETGCDAIVGNDKRCALRLREIPYIYLEDAIRQV